MTDSDWKASDRTTAADRIPIDASRYEFADGVYIGGNDSFVHLPPRPRRPSHFEQRMAEIAAWREKQRRRHVMYWKVILLVALALGALLMVAVTSGCGPSIAQKACQGHGGVAGDSGGIVYCQDGSAQ